MKKIYSILTILLLTSCLNLLMNDTPDEDEKKQEQVDPGDGEDPGDGQDPGDITPPVVEDKGYKELIIEDKYSNYIVKRMDIPNTTTDIKIDGNNLYYTIKLDIHDEVNPTSVLGVMDITDPDNPKNLTNIGNRAGLSYSAEGDDGHIYIDNGYIIVTRIYSGGSFIYDLNKQEQVNFLPSRIAKNNNLTVRGETYGAAIHGNRLFISYINDYSTVYGWLDGKYKRGVVIYDMDNISSYDMDYIPPTWKIDLGTPDGSKYIAKDSESMFLLSHKEGYIFKKRFSEITVPNGDAESYNANENEVIKTSKDYITNIEIVDNYLIVLYDNQSSDVNDPVGGALVYDKNDLSLLYNIELDRKPSNIKVDSNNIYLSVGFKKYTEGSIGGIMVLDRNNLANYANNSADPKVLEIGVEPKGFDVKGNRAYVASGQTPTIADITIVKLD